MDLKISVQCRMEGRERSFDLEFKKDEVTIGRRSDNDVQLPDNAVSGQHARIYVEGGILYVEDLNSSNGTQVNGKRIEAPVPLGFGATLSIVDYRIQVTRPAEELSELTAEKTDLVAMKMVREVLASFGGSQEPPYLEVLNDDEAGARLKLDVAEGEYRIGREKGCDLRLRHWSISRRHALVRKSYDVVTVVDLDSKNGVSVNGDRLTTSRVLAEDDVLAVGHTEMKYCHPSGGLADDMDDTPTPFQSLKDIGVDVSAIVSGEERDDAHEEDTGAFGESRSDPKPKPKPAPATAGDPAPPPRGDRPAPPEESSFFDYLPIIIGILLAIGAVVAAVVTFVL